MKCKGIHVSRMLRKDRDIDVLGLCRDCVCEEGVYDWFLGDLP